MSALARGAAGTRTTVAASVKVDPIRCDAHGMCAELLPERITLDDWGYPIVDGRPLEPELMAHAKLAAAACPVLAIKLAARVPAPSRST